MILSLVLFLTAPVTGFFMTRARMIEYQQSRNGSSADTDSVVIQPANAYEMDDREPDGNPDHRYVGDLAEVTRPGNTGVALGVLGFISWLISGRILKRRKLRGDETDIRNESAYPDPTPECRAEAPVENSSAPFHNRSG